MLKWSSSLGPRSFKSVYSPASICLDFLLVGDLSSSCVSSAKAKETVAGKVHSRSFLPSFSINDLILSHVCDRLTKQDSCVSKSPPHMACLPLHCGLMGQLIFYTDVVKHPSL